MLIGPNLDVTTTTDHALDPGGGVILETSQFHLVLACAVIR